MSLDSWIQDLCPVFFFKQKTAYEMRISDWSSDVCSSDLVDISAESTVSRLSSKRKAKISPGDARAARRFPSYRVGSAIETSQNHAVALWDNCVRPQLSYAGMQIADQKGRFKKRSVPQWLSTGSNGKYPGCSRPTDA